MVFDAVQTNRFYILTHPKIKPAIEMRMKDILEGRSPPTRRDPSAEPLFWEALGSPCANLA